MKQIRLLLSVSIFLIVVSCSQSSKKDTTGTLRVTSRSVNPYSIQIDYKNGSVLPGNSFINYTLSEGNHHVKATQLSGYILYPSVYENNVAVFSGGQSEFVFP